MAEVSLFAGQPAAPIDKHEEVSTQLSILFPQMKSEFWGMLAKMTLRAGLSEQRLDYIVDYLSTHHNYPTLTMADVLGVDKHIKIWSYNAFYKEFGTTEKAGYCILKERGNDGCIQYANTAIARHIGLEIMRECIE